MGAIARESYKTGEVGTLALTLGVISGEGDAVEEMAMARTVMRVQDNTLDWLGIQQADEVVEQDRLAGVRRNIVGLPKPENVLNQRPHKHALKLRAEQRLGARP